MISFSFGRYHTTGVPAPSVRSPLVGFNTAKPKSPVMRTNEIHTQFDIIVIVQEHIRRFQITGISNERKYRWIILER